MPDQHAKVTASGYERWAHCPPSVSMESNFIDTGSEAAQEGTEAHAVAEKKLIAWKATGRIDPVECADGTMQESTDEYARYVIEVFNSLSAKGQNPELDVEVREDLSPWIPEGFGTSDAVISSFAELHVIDFKYGKSVQVPAKNNGQLRLYALGAIHKYWDLLEFDKVTMHIFQPRMGHIDSETMTVEELKAWGEGVKPIARMAFDGQGEAQVGPWCQFCRAACVCKKRAETMFSPYKNHLDVEEAAIRKEIDHAEALGVPKADIREALPDIKARCEESAMLTVQELIERYPPEVLDDVSAWAKRLKDFYLTQALTGESLPGYKLVEGRSTRTITDAEGVAEALKKIGKTEEEIWKPKELQTLTSLEKLVGKKTFAEVCSSYIDKPPGKPKLAPVSDRRKTWVPDSPDMMFGPAQNDEKQKKKEED